MSETNILLPTASVDIYIRDSQTMESARRLRDDWRFARVQVNVIEGDVDSAIQTYKQERSPTLVMIETQDTGEEFIEALGTLSAHCAEGTNAIVIGPVNDVDLYRNLTQMGVRDYLVKPVALATLSDVIANALIAQLGTSGSRLISVIGAKGGVGASALSQALAWGVAKNLGQKTCLMDAAGGWSGLSVGMGYEPATTTEEAVRAVENKDADMLARMFHAADEKLNVLATGGESMLDNSVSAAQYESLVDYLMVSYPYLLVDLSSAIPSLKRIILSKSHKIIVVTTPTLSALRSARSLMNEIKILHDGDDKFIELVVNKQGMNSGNEVPLKDIEKALDYKPNAIIPFEPKLFLSAENEGAPLYKTKAGAEITAKLLAIIEDVTKNTKAKEGNIQAQGAIGSLLHKLSGKG